MRESCFSCDYNNLRSGSDITVGDLWGAEVLYTDIFDNTGMSLVSVQSTKGMGLMESISDSVVLYKKSIQELTKYNQGFYHAFRKSKRSETYHKESTNKGRIRALKMVARPDIREKISSIIRRFKRRNKHGYL